MRGWTACRLPSKSVAPKARDVQKISPGLRAAIGRMWKGGKKNQGCVDVLLLLLLLPEESSCWSYLCPGSSPSLFLFRSAGSPLLPEQRRHQHQHMWL